MKTIEDFFKSYNFEYLSQASKLEEPYVSLWNELYRPSQEKKIIENNVSEEVKLKAFNGLSKRGKFLCDIYDFFECKNIAEVGTAEGYQFFTFCNHIQKKETDCKVYTCDIRDVRNNTYINKYGNIENFVAGTSKEMADKIISDENKIDLFWIDGAHTTSAVLYDVLRLAKTQSKNAIWLFDDFNKRFGIYEEINFLSNFNQSHSLSLGPTASGKPNNMLILSGGF